MSISTLDRRTRIHKQRHELTRRKWLDSVSLLAILSTVMLIVTTSLFGVQGSRAPAPLGVAAAPRPTLSPSAATPTTDVAPTPPPQGDGTVVGIADNPGPTATDVVTSTPASTEGPAPTATFTSTPLPTATTTPLPFTVALIAGHRNNDSGAICESGPYAGLWEVHLTTAITEKLVRRLQEAGYQVIDLDEFDPRLHGLKADALLSLHIDSCVDWPGTTGYKIVRSQSSAIPEVEDRLVSCIDESYMAATALEHHPTSITQHMSDYHAFRKIDLQTPAAIIELGFLYHDNELLTQNQELIVEALKEGFDCFLLGQ